MENSMFPRNCTEALAMLYVQNMSSNAQLPKQCVNYIGMLIFV